MSLPISRSEIEAVSVALDPSYEPYHARKGASQEEREQAKAAWDEQHGPVEDAAIAGIRAFLDVRNGREMYGHMVFQRTKEPQVPNVYGLWATVATANKNLPAGLDGDRAVLVKIHQGKAVGHAVE